MFFTNKTENPGIEELMQEKDYELVAELTHSQIKEFVLGQLTSHNLIIRSFMIYQFLMILIGIFFLTRSVVLVFRGFSEPFLYTLAGIIFTLSFLIVIHELLHGLALKITGAPKVTYGGYLKKFIFYAEADRHVLNRKQFKLVALMPLVAVKILTLTGILFFWTSPAICFFILLMSAHSLFCAGDIGLLSFFYNDDDDEIYTYDVRAEKKSYYYKRVSD